MRCTPAVVTLAVTTLVLAATGCSGSSNSPTDTAALMSSVRTR